ncbi:energy-coupling factor transport system ATP-binding protein [Melghirimyces profundicolus]|uniref:ABC transporter ATP-binding protein n=1 Tax=Melghirimyces profundicolus TaxID=1242148 RepID=A0A2T6C8H1_9BACL|nr:energy-coupling factor transporter ATPase [Melghirimyces profundicolus]PTX64610.1 energy-coupling factor transport system ATP-binding protein [Melghirimyces profundicolus]
MSASPLIEVKDLYFSYRTHGETFPVLRGITLRVNRGEHVAVIGHNGSGKSTLAKHLNGLLLPDEGAVWVQGLDTREKKHLREIRRRVGMVFQHPDNQLVATIVEEDVAFGLENLSVPPEEMADRVTDALRAVGMEDFRKRPPHHLSGGQKQRVAIGGILAMRPDCLVLDEATSMLDSFGRKEILQVVRRLHGEGIAVVSVTHHMSEAAEADRVIVLEKGRIALEGTPREVFREREQLSRLRLDVPEAGRIASRVHAGHPGFPDDLYRREELVEAVERFTCGKVEVNHG